MRVRIKFNEPPGRLWISNFGDTIFDVVEQPDNNYSFVVCPTSKNISRIRCDKNTSESFKSYLVAKINYTELEIPKSHCEVL